MASVAKTSCWWLLTKKVVSRLNSPLFYLLVYLKTAGMPCLKKINVSLKSVKTRNSDNLV